MTQRWQVDDEEIIEAVREAFQEGETDLVDGGVHPSTVADRVDIETSTAHHRCRELAADGELVKCRGADPETWRVRTSYVLPSQEDADEI